ncbi:MAG: AMP-binding protein, partial [Muribaculaceae bacterium]|nr:AMP-binding protein [Muribaculaceae bacterium]
PVPRLLEKSYRICDRNIFRPIRRAMGVDRGKMFPTAGAPIGDTVNEFFHALGVNVLVGYGLSETTATVSCYPSAGYRIGSVGTALDGIDVRIDPETLEVQVKAPTVMRGYWNKPEETEAAFTHDGWFRTGDAGRIDDEGNLWITDRIKDLIKTSNGKYIAPQALESLLTEDRFIEQAAVIGEGRKFVTALIVPSVEAIRRYARTRRGMRQADTISSEALLNLPWVKEYIMKRISRIQYRLARYEWVKRITLLSQQFTMDSGELTNTLKLRRPVINDHYKKEIDEMYDDPSAK